MSIRRLKLSELNRPGQCVSVYRTFYPPGLAYPEHTHEFAELFLVESGEGTQLMANRHDALVPGSVGFVDPACSHRLVADRGGSMVLTNVGFDRMWLDRLRPALGTIDWPWRAGESRVGQLTDEDRRACLLYTSPSPRDH
jgi:hypothetical protein